MNEATHVSVDAHLPGNWMAWLALRHFLTAGMLRRLLHVATERASDGRLRFEMLFEDAHENTSTTGATWLMRPRDVDDRFAGYLQRLTRSVVWRNDEGGWFDATAKEEGDAATARALDSIVSLGAADFGWPSEAITVRAPSGFVQPSLEHFCRALTSARERHATDGCEEFWKALDAALAPLDMPLRAVAAKHIADLCADADVWDKALAGYRHVQIALDGWTGDSTWDDSVTAWKDIALQSTVTALRIVEGPQSASDVVGPAIMGGSLATNPLLLANASFDAYVLASHPDAEGYKARDRRVGQVHAPLLLSEYDDGHPIRLWLNGSHDQAARRFWSLLRRQIALGAAIEARQTKAWYGRSLFAHLLETLRKNTVRETFQLAVRLVVEAETPDVVARITWSEGLIDTYVDAACVELAFSHARTFAGNRRERLLVVTALFKEWISLIAPAKRDLAVVMWKHIATLARDFPVFFESTVDLGRRSLRALQELAPKRPEWRRDVGTDVTAAICRKLGPKQPWLGQVAALETALAYVDALPDTEVGTLAMTTLALISDLDPATDVWPLVRPALQLLVCRAVKRIVRDDASLGRAILSQIIRFGVEQESENARLFFYLHDFDSALLSDPAVRERLLKPVTEVRRRALEIQSTQVTESIEALLLAPAVSGEDGVKDALDGLARILASATSPRESMGLAVAYDAFLLLADTHEAITEALPGAAGWFPPALTRIVSLVEDVWRAAAKRPTLFAPFAFPPAKKPDAIVVHNWAFASLRLGEEFGAMQNIEGALAIASESDELRQPIALAHATRAAARPDEEDPIQQVEMDDRNAFYLMLGRRLVQLRTKGPEEAHALCKVLVSQCLRFGPRDLDAAVFLEAARLDLTEHVRASGVEHYVQRLQNNRDLRIGLRPIVDMFKAKVVEST